MDLDKMLNPSYDDYQELNSPDDIEVFRLVNKSVVEDLHTKDLYDTSLVKIGQRVLCRFEDRGIGLVVEVDPDQGAVGVDWDKYSIRSWNYPNQLKRL
jgi:hypothetical protein